MPEAFGDVEALHPWIINWFIREASVPTVYMGGPDSPEFDVSMIPLGYNMIP